MGYFTDRGIRRAVRKTAKYTKKDYKRAVRQDRYVRDEPFREAERARLAELRERDEAMAGGATMPPPPPAVPPGWYPDPTDPRLVTWWDGVRWIPESRRSR